MLDQLRALDRPRVVFGEPTGQPASHDGAAIAALLPFENQPQFGILLNVMIAARRAALHDPFERMRGPTLVTDKRRDGRIVRSRDTEGSASA